MKKMDEKQFVEEIFEIAFGDDAINKDYSFEEVVAKIREFSDLALEVEECQSPTPEGVGLSREVRE